MTDALVLGGGLAGSGAAILLARAGRSVSLIERETGPHHNVCGEFLSIEARDHLEALGDMYCTCGLGRKLACSKGRSFGKLGPHTPGSFPPATPSGLHDHGLK